MKVDYSLDQIQTLYPHQSTQNRRQINERITQGDCEVRLAIEWGICRPALSLTILYYPSPFIISPSFPTPRYSPSRFIHHLKRGFERFTRSSISKDFTVPLGGQESYKFAPNRGFYVGVNDDRILRYKGSKAGWEMIKRRLENLSPEERNDMEIRD
ncbi:hypothetical protein LguiA_001524 [Lonicera macranthoides]